MEQAEKVHNQIRGAITGGLANVWHRKNVAGETKINHLYFENDKVVSRDSVWPMTHSTGIDFNSLYPFSMGSIRTPFNPYDNGVMYMTGNLKEYSDDHDRIKVLFESMYNTRYQDSDEDAKNGSVFIITIKAHMPK
jgi:hypothetical protein